MEPGYTFLLCLLLYTGFSESAECDVGWVKYKEEQCIKAFTSLLNYDDAKQFCSDQSNEVSNASLVTVKDTDLQDLLGQYTQDIYNTLWLGGKYDEETMQYLWDDGEPFSYTNWQEGYPRNSTNTACVELRPVNARTNTNQDGKWFDVNCQKLNFVLCQKPPLTWGLEDAIEKIIRVGKQVEKLQTEVVPIGTIYTEYYNQQSPQDIWPGMTWEDVSSSYAGLFFRIFGGESDEWGVTQNDCAPQITEMKFGRGQGSFPDTVSIPPSGWSEFCDVGAQVEYPGSYWFGEGIRFHTEGGEVRPRNQAIRVWKRVA